MVYFFNLDFSLRATSFSSLTEARMKQEARQNANLSFTESTMEFVPSKTPYEDYSLSRSPPKQLFSRKTATIPTSESGLVSFEFQGIRARASSRDSETSSIITSTTGIDLSDGKGKYLTLAAGYENGMPYVQKLIEKKTRELFPEPLEELGPKVMFSSTSNLSVQRGKIVPDVYSNDLKNWRPTGRFVAHLAEHKQKINQMALSPDHKFFASASDDGTVKLWDTKRLEKNPINRSVITLSQEGCIKCIDFCENSHSLVYSNDKGLIQMTRIEYFDTNKSSGNVFKDFNINIEGNDDRVVAIDHYNKGCCF